MSAEQGAVGSRPIGKHVYVRLDEQYGKRMGDIYLPDSVAAKKTWSGRVLASTAEADNEAGIPLTGKRVVLRGYAGRFLSDEANAPWICPVGMVECVLEGDDDGHTKVTGGGSPKGLERCPKCGPANSKISQGSPLLEPDPDRPVGSKRRRCPRCLYTQE